MSLEDLVDRHMSELSPDERALACGVQGVAKVQAVIATMDTSRMRAELEEAISLIDAGAQLLTNAESAEARVYRSFVEGFGALARALLAEL